MRDAANPRIDNLRQHGIAVVLMDRIVQDARAAWCAVGVDDVTGGELAVEHVIERGHRRIVFIGGPRGLRQVDDRQAGARRAVESSDLDASSLVPVETSSLTFADGRLAGEEDEHVHVLYDACT